MGMQTDAATQLATDTAELLAAYHHATANYVAAEQQVASWADQRCKAIADLNAAGLSQRQIAAWIGITAARVQQLIERGKVVATVRTGFLLGQLYREAEWVELAARGEVVTVAEKLGPKVGSDTQLAVGRVLARATELLGRLDAGDRDRVERRLASLVEAVGEIPDRLDQRAHADFWLGYWVQVA